MGNKKFKLVKPGTDEDVLGVVDEENAYIKTYGARLPGEIAVADLLPGEGSLHRYSLSGSTGVYKIVRVE